MRFIEFSRQVEELWSDWRLAAEGWAQRGLIVARQIDSTNLLARRILADYQRENLVPPAAEILAWEQLSGRGRHERRWASPAGAGVYLTVIRPLQDPSPMIHLPLIVAVAICETVNEHVAGRCRLKWPNDLMVAGRKLGGILTEVVGRGSDSQSILVGVGLNHADPGAGAAHPRATSIRALDPAGPTLPLCCRDLARSIDGALAAGADFSDWRQRYLDLSAHRQGDTLRCRLGDEVVEGIFRGFDERGFLRLEVGGEERLLSAGEVMEHA